MRATPGKLTLDGTEFCASWCPSVVLGFVSLLLLATPVLPGWAAVLDAGGGLLRGPSVQSLSMAASPNRNAVLKPRPCCCSPEKSILKPLAEDPNENCGVCFSAADVASRDRFPATFPCRSSTWPDPGLGVAATPVRPDTAAGWGCWPPPPPPPPIPNWNDIPAAADVIGLLPKQYPAVGAVFGGSDV